MKDRIHGLHFIINTDSVQNDSCLDLAEKAILGGADSLQFRHKATYTREIYALACRLAEICRKFSVPLIVNDRVDIAMAIGASGVHLGQTDLPVEAARKLIGRDKIIGATTSTLEEAKEAERQGADYIGFGHIFPTRTKIKNTPPLGVVPLQTVCRQISIPILAIGGIDAGNLDEVCRAGAYQPQLKFPI